MSDLISRKAQPAPDIAALVVEAEAWLGKARKWPGDSYEGAQLLARAVSALTAQAAQIQQANALLSERGFDDPSIVDAIKDAIALLDNEQGDIGIYRKRTADLEHQRDTLAARLAEVERELQSVDAALARIPALDKPTRRENIEHAIATARKADAALTRAEQAEAALYKAVVGNKEQPTAVSINIDREALLKRALEDAKEFRDACDKSRKDRRRIGGNDNA